MFDDEETMSGISPKRFRACEFAAAVVTREVEKRRRLNPNFNPDGLWAKGFDATTYGEPETVTGLRRQSLVYAFGDKRELFEKALRLYVDQRVEEKK